MKYYSGGEEDPYLDKASGVLRNLLGITKQTTLEVSESSLSFLRANQLRASPLRGNFDLTHLQAIHKRLFGDVYDWAGQIRTVEIIKGSTHFARRLMIVQAARVLFDELAKENRLVGLNADEFALRAAYYLGEINVLHPFREGNGRAQREFTGQLALRAGHRIEWGLANQDEMIKASIDAYNGDCTRMAQLIRSCMRA
jgi:cell filamentation protein